MNVGGEDYSTHIPCALSNTNNRSSFVADEDTTAVEEQRSGKQQSTISRMVYTRIRDDYYPLGLPIRCTHCSRMYCIWRFKGPEIIGDFVDWMNLVDDNDDRFIDIEEERRHQTVEHRKKRIYSEIIYSIYGVEDNDNIEPPACVQWGVFTMPDNLYWTMHHPPIRR